MFHNNLKLKVSVSLIIALSAAMGLFILLIVKHQMGELQNEVSRHVMQMSEVIVKSTRYAMLMNNRDIAAKIIQDIGRQKGIERVRVISKDGTIIHSNRSSEIGHSIDQQAEPCVKCHQTSKTLEHVTDDMRWAIFRAPEGKRSLGTMQAIRNEPSCSSSSCHEHPASQSVLGIVDIAYSLDEIDQKTKTHTINLIGISLGFILLVSVSVGVLLQRLIYLPLKDLESGAKKIASGSLDQDIPVRSDDEFGRVAGSFNQMTAALHESRLEMQELVQTLELKVAERTHELLAAKAEVAQGEKLASIGVLASGIAHELNSPLTGVLTFTSLMRKKTADGSEDAADLDLVIRETKRCASIIRRLLDFAREKVPEKGFFSLNQVIEDTVRFVERSASLQQIEITTNLDPELPQVWGDADLLKQVIMNLLVNAEQAIGSHGNIIVESRPYIAAGLPKPGVKPFSMVEIAVTDTGCGIPEANLQRIFDPFFTSKEVGKGTGLGLSVSYGIVKAHGGKINVESVVGAGTTFRVYLPVTFPFGETDNNAGESSL
ncbi:MAG: HAMP domain-containing protein [Polaromonas sp.]|nr:HAMP domain-containing protein [Polaromonas sp.]